MHKVIEDFLLTNNWQDRSQAIERIVSSDSILKEALNEKNFLEIVFAPHQTNCWVTPRLKVVSKTLLKFPDKLLNLSPEYFIVSLPAVNKTVWHCLTKESQGKIIKRVLSITEELEDSGPQLSIALSPESFLADIDYKLAAQAIAALAKHPRCSLYLSHEFLPILGTLSSETFKKVMDNIDYNFFCDEKEFVTLSRKHQCIFLQELIKRGGCIPLKDILAFKSIKKAFFDKNAEEILKHFDSCPRDESYIRKVLESKIQAFKKQPSKFARLSALMWSRLSKDLFPSDLKKYIKLLAAADRSAWAGLLQNESIVKESLTVIEKAVRCYCGLKNPPTPIYLDIPDKTISRLTLNQLVGLVKKELDSQGAFRRLTFNPILVAQKLSPLALTRPAYYKKEVAGILSLAIERDKYGESLPERMCNYLGIPTDDPFCALADDKDILREAIRKASSAKLLKTRELYMSFVADLLCGKEFAELQTKYQDLTRQV